MHIAIVGATGQVGAIMLKTLLERRFPADKITLAASSRSAGCTVRVGERDLVVVDAEALDARDVDIVLMSAGATASRHLAPRYAEEGAVVIDNSSCWRMDPTVPLIVTGVNDHAIAEADGIIANPNCSAAIALTALKPLADAFGLRTVIASTYQSVSGMGRAGSDKLRRETEDLAFGLRSWEDRDSARLVGNVIPEIGSVGVDGRSGEEVKFCDESRRVLALPNLTVHATCVRVPVMVGHAISLHVRTYRPADVGRVCAALAAASQLELCDTPTPAVAAGQDRTLVGRLRVEDDTISLFAVGDNLRKGAALNAVQIAELLI